MVEIPLTSNSPYFSQEHQIFDFCYIFEFMWIEKYWVLHLYDAAKKPIALGLKIILDGTIFADPISKLVLLLWPKQPQALLTLESFSRGFALVAYIDETI